MVKYFYYTKKGISTMQQKILQYIYKHFKETGKPLCYVIFNQIDNNTSAVKNSIKNLEEEGFIETSHPAIGAIYAYLTDYGLSFFE